MISRRIFLKGVAATMVATYLTGCKSDNSSGNDKKKSHQNWKLAVLPDTQKYSENSLTSNL